MNTQHAAILGIWREMGAEAIPSMQRVAAQLAANPANSAAVSQSKVVAAAIKDIQNP